MAHVVREGGFAIIFVARLSAIPGYVQPCTMYSRVVQKLV